MISLPAKFLFLVGLALVAVPLAFSQEPGTLPLAPEGECMGASASVLGSAPVQITLKGNHSRSERAVTISYNRTAHPFGTWALVEVPGGETFLVGPSEGTIFVTVEGPPEACKSSLAPPSDAVVDAAPAPRTGVSGESPRALSPLAPEESQ